jgi:hypothetical protein
MQVFAAPHGMDAECERSCNDLLSRLAAASGHALRLLGMRAPSPAPPYGALPVEEIGSNVARLPAARRYRRQPRGIRHAGRCVPRLILHRLPMEIRC